MVVESLKKSIRVQLASPLFLNHFEKFKQFRGMKKTLGFNFPTDNIMSRVRDVNVRVVNSMPLVLE